MDYDDAQDLIDRRDVLLETIEAGVSDRDLPHLVAELTFVLSQIRRLSGRPGVRLAS